MLGTLGSIAPIIKERARKMEPDLEPGEPEVFGPQTKRGLADCRRTWNLLKNLLPQFLFTLFVLELFWVLLGDFACGSYKLGRHIKKQLSRSQILAEHLI